jgi:hypothetical protein
VTAYYVVEDPDDFFADDFGNDDALPPGRLLAASFDVNWDEDPDEFFADDYGNDDAVVAKVPRRPVGLTVTLH